jgi:hypothetical protein
MEANSRYGASPGGVFDKWRQSFLWKELPEALEFSVNSVTKTETITNA